MKKHWEIKINPATNLRILQQFIKASILTGIVMALLLGFIFLASGETDMLWFPVLSGILSCCFLFIASWTVLLIIYRNKLTYLYTITNTGIAIETRSNPSKILSRLAIIIGILKGSPTAIGAGLLSTSREKTILRWKEVNRIHLSNLTRSIKLSSGLRDLEIIFCTKNNFSEISEFVTQRVRQNSKSNAKILFISIVQTCAVLLALTPLFGIDDIVEVHLLIKILLLCFALATIWLIPLMGAVVIALGIYAASAIVCNLLVMRESTLFVGETYRYIELLEPHEWIYLGITMMGLGYLLLAALLYLGGKIQSALIADD